MNKTFFSVAIMMAITIVFVIGCSKNNETTLAATTTPITATCDTVNMKYLANVLPIIQTNCYSCHGNGNASGGATLDSYTSLKKYAANGYLVGNITHAPGYVGMPYNQPKMDSCSINKIISWVKNGALNN